MKTPREILLAQHRAAEPKLDALRRSVVATVTNGHCPRPDAHPALLKSIWHELILPSRRTWAGLASAWVLLIACNLALHNHSSVSSAQPMTASALASYGEQQKILNELFADRSPAIVADRPKNYSPKPRTEKFQAFNV